MLRATNEERGTVAGLTALSQALDDEHADGKQGVSFIKRLLMILIDGVPYRYPATPVHCRSERPLTSNSLPLHHSATFFEYVVIDGKRFYASRTVGWNKSSFVHVVIPGTSPQDAYAEVLEILQIDQDFRNAGHPLWLAQVRWLKPWRRECDQIWDKM